jgi:CheY-like chemotaxis protein/anti-sigma regulatory factor (Ser/Thr protein kinase)
LFVNVDGARLVQAIANLLHNAAKFTRPGGVIDVEAALVDDSITIEVRDNGIGISASLLPHVFDLFVRAGKRERGGLGVGLAIAKTFTELHGGTLMATSDGPGRGSTFTITLPRWTQPASDATEQPAMGRHRILVVDDNEDAAWLLAEALRFAGHDVVTSHDGVDALERARAWRPHIAFLDVGLPGMDGYQLCRHLSELPMRPKVVAVTGYGQPSDRQRALAAGFDMHFVKPVSLREVHSAIETFSKAPIA